MDHHDDGAAGGGQLAEQLEDLELVAQVEGRGGLVEQQHGGVLRDSPRDPGALPLPAGQGLQRPVGQVGDVGGGERPVHGLLVLRGPLPQQTLVRLPAEAHEVGHGESVRGLGRLRQQADGAGRLAGRQLRQHAPVEQDGAALRPVLPA